MWGAISKRSDLPWAGLAEALLRRFQDFRTNSASTKRKRQLNLLESLHLGGKRQLLLVQVGEHRVLLGAGADSIESMMLLPEEKSELVQHSRSWQGEGGF